MASPHQGPLPDVLGNYEMWTKLTRVGIWELTRMRNEAPRLTYQPRISILLPVYDPKRAWLEQALDSVMSQTYPHWELCICNDGSTEPHVEEVLSLYERLDERIRVKHLEQNENIVRATNEAFFLATGELVTLMDHDDALAPHALFEVVRFLQERPDADLIYTDEEKIDEAGAPFKPHFKPGWSPDFALSVNYLVHLSVYRRSLLEEIGGWREGFDGAQDLDLMLRYTEKTQKIHHLPKILYRWRMVEGSVATDTDFKAYTHERARRAVQDALERRGVRGQVLDGFLPNTFRVDREIEGRPKVSVLIPLREGSDHDRCVASLERNTTYPNYEVLLVKNEAARLKARSLPARARVVQVAGEPTPLELYNAAIREASGEFVLLLDPELEVVSNGWLEALLQHAQRAEVGAVGGKFVSPEGLTLQAGLVLDPEGPEGSPQIFYRPFNRQHGGFRMFVDLVRNCSAVSGECIMFHKETFVAAGEFDAENLRDTFGDVDLCLRLGEQGYSIVYTPYAEFVHHAFKPRVGLEPKQAEYAWGRWRELLENDPYYNPNLRWDAGDLHATLSMIGLGHEPRVAERASASGDPKGNT